MKEVIFEVQGSAEEPYKVRFVSKFSEKLSAYCTCKAGENGQHCKHRFAILEGDVSGIISSNHKEIEIVRSWLKGTDLEMALNEMRQLSNQAQQVNAALNKAKKNLAKVMRD